MTPSSVALYLRVSTEDQDLAGQERDLRIYAETKGWTVGAVFAEKLSARGHVERAVWEELRQEATLPETRRFDCVLVWARDRWSRDQSFVKAVGSIEQPELLGIHFHRFREPALDSGDGDAPSLARDLLRGILPAIASFESRRRSERTQLAMDEIRSGRRRTSTGRPPGPPCKVTPAIEAKVNELRARGLEHREIAPAVHLPVGTVKKVPRAPGGETPAVENGPAGFATQGSNTQ